MDVICIDLRGKSPVTKVEVAAHLAIIGMILENKQLLHQACDITIDSLPKVVK